MLLLAWCPFKMTDRMSLLSSDGRLANVTHIAIAGVTENVTIRTTKQLPPRNGSAGPETTTPPNR
jgi:hypothetical protein